MIYKYVNKSYPGYLFGLEIDNATDPFLLITCKNQILETDVSSDANLLLRFLCLFHLFVLRLKSKEIETSKTTEVHQTNFCLINHKLPYH